MMLEEDSYLLEYLEKDIEGSKKEIKEGKGLSQRGATAMLLKGMYNHIRHLDEKMVTKEEFNLRFNILENKFAVLKNDFNFTKWLIATGFVMLAALQSYLAFYMRTQK
ncbi:MAG: hypothetical protein WC838_03470 [Candidatus Margulisiibacteriota bacterium]|jgi:hypothetical protein